MHLPKLTPTLHKTVAEEQKRGKRAPNNQKTIPQTGRPALPPPNLAPYQAKDMTSAIERVSPALTLPDWQDLRASVEIGE